MNNQSLKHIAIAGNIGAGKTSLTDLLSKHYNWTPQYEVVDNNPYLIDFYEDMSRWSFNLQIYFLNKRLNQLLDIKNAQNTIVQDRTIYEDAKIFAVNLADMGLMTPRDFHNYATFFDTISEMITPPDLIIYLKASIPKLVDQIQKRGRAYEDNIRLDYLKKLNQHYNDWATNYKDGEILIIDIDNIDFITKEEDFQFIITLIENKIKGLD